MKRILTTIMALSMFVTSTAFAHQKASIGTMIRDYKVDVRVNNVDPKMALDNLTRQLVQSKMTKKELMDYVKTQMTAEEFNTFLAVVDHGKKELEGAGEVNTAEFQFILSEAIASANQNSGANYAGCRVAVGFGVAFILAGLVLGFLALDSRGTWDDDGDGVVFDDTAGDHSDRTRGLGIAAGVTGAVGIALTFGGGAC